MKWTMYETTRHTLVIDEGNNTIAVVGGLTKEDRERNARLIAKAPYVPELLEALKETTAALEIVSDHVGSSKKELKPYINLIKKIEVVG